MKRFSRSKRSLALTSAVLVLLSCALILSPPARLQVHARPDATQPPLGTAGNFAVLGASTVTNTGPTVVNGDLGVSPGTAVTGFPPGIVIGTIHAADAVALQAQKDAATAYVNAAGQPCDVNLTGQDLGGKTLTSGVYCFSSSATQEQYHAHIATLLVRLYSSFHPLICPTQSSAWWMDRGPVLSDPTISQIARQSYRRHALSNIRNKGISCQPNYLSTRWASHHSHYRGQYLYRASGSVIRW